MKQAFLCVFLLPTVLQLSFYYCSVGLDLSTSFVLQATICSFEGPTIIMYNSRPHKIYELLAGFCDSLYGFSLRVPSNIVGRGRSV